MVVKGRGEPPQTLQKPSKVNRLSSLRVYSSLSRDAYTHKQVRTHGYVEIAESDKHSYRRLRGTL
jgi:hypothetical protein